MKRFKRSAQNLKAGDYCKRGHLLTENTLYVYSDGRTCCKECDKLRRRRNPRRKEKQIYYEANRQAIQLVRGGVAAGLVAARAILVAEQREAI